MRDGCGRGCNEFAVGVHIDNRIYSIIYGVQNHHVRFSRGVSNHLKFCTRFRNLDDLMRFQDFDRDFPVLRDFLPDSHDFKISPKISRFQLRFQDFSVDFKISEEL